MHIHMHMQDDDRHSQSAYVHSSDSLVSQAQNAPVQLHLWHPLAVCPAMLPSGEADHAQCCVTMMVMHQQRQEIHHHPRYY
jgi:hypothetical protein